MEALRKDRIDLGFAQVPMGVGEMAAHLVASVPLAAALPATHRLAGRAKIDVAALADEPFIVIPRESAPGYFDLTAATCLAGGFSPNFRHYAKHLLSVISLVALGRGVALVPRTLGTAAVPGVVLKPLTGAPAHAQYSAIWHPENPSPVLARAVALLGAGG
ncbi:HTH-type transcriptional regulator GltC [compost metagenome]